ncbi:AT hook motif family protein [Tritrichomonas foetus]|uniref:AT hook motif family protein n=1 Tax=Tritrichomonas foetus TaxID=1144522 RepID=A0A1J4L696_9EUKA|nr:AT hook motif family protein [Tritrichomonas foetus]|eukprot:OHT17470.1 AT hook motif family protein [Tritrichomonas foetus]
MKNNAGSAADSHTDFEQSTLTYALLKGINEPFAEGYKEKAFPHEQAKDNSETILSSLPKDFFPNLIQNSLPKTNHPSLIHNFGRFKVETNKRQDRRSRLIYDRLKHIVLTHRIVGHTRCARTLLIDPYNILFFTGSDDTNIKCWHIPSLSLICTMKGHEDPVCGLVISPDRKLLASFAAKEDKFVRIWSLVNGAAVAVIPSNDDGYITSICFSPCNRFLGIASSSGDVRFIHITSLIPMLLQARETIQTDDKFLTNTNVGDLLFADGDFSTFNEIDPQNFIKNPPKLQKHYPLKSPSTYVSFSPGGNFALATLENGALCVLSMTNQRRWTIQAHDAAADGGMFLKNSFHNIITWSQKGGEIKTWLFNDKLKHQLTFTVRVANSRRSHLVAASVSCDESLLYACTSQSIFAWRIDNATPLRHIDDNPSLAGCVGVEAHPHLPTVFMAITKSLITIWDLSLTSSQEPIHTLIIPVETPRIHMAKWAPDGLSVIATDAGGNSGGGVFVFRLSEEPECRTMPQFFNSDFTASEWIPGKGQIEEGNKQPTHLQDKSTLTDSERVNVYIEYIPLKLDEKSIAVKPTYTPALKHAWLNEELWLRRLDKGGSISQNSGNIQTLSATIAANSTPDFKSKTLGRPMRKPKFQPEIEGDESTDSSNKDSDSDDPNVTESESDSPLPDNIRSDSSDNE